ncbi:MAG TPA: SMC-Scp complex subunit ScpB [Flavisolibacter sp.]|jgi:segregation and condensation protein B|nr:SMC-Scp complex subunit ScpB [Flavisolibacter sp.]
MEISNLIPHIEALIFASDKPLTAPEITELINQAFGFMEEKIAVEQIEASLEGIVEKYQSEFYPFEVRQSGGGWQFLTKKDFHKTVAQLNGEKFLKRLSAAALETLAIVAYKQPVTKGEIEAIRGVSSDYAVQKLLEKELIMISGRNEKLPGHPLVYATSKNFMDYFGINSPEDLPRIKEVLADQVIEPTVVNHTDFEQSETLAVTGEGQLIDADESSPSDASAAQEETYVNGHTIEGLIEEEPGTEDEPTEEAIEEYISDELFIEGDDIEEAGELLEEDNQESSDAPEASFPDDMADDGEQNEGDTEDSNEPDSRK